MAVPAMTGWIAKGHSPDFPAARNFFPNRDHDCVRQPNVMGFPGEARV